MTSSFSFGTRSISGSKFDKIDVVHTASAVLFDQLKLVSNFPFSTFNDFTKSSPSGDLVNGHVILIFPFSSKISFQKQFCNEPNNRSKNTLR